MAKKKLNRGDNVTWRSHGQSVKGSVIRKIEGRTDAGGRTVDASEEDPQYEVKSRKTGSKAVHRPEALKKNRGKA
ncbi:DUF2945 domain-containing protein [Streptomyces sp. CS131]|uniref:DUF2945 domain-containing protein n=1 Tax=Streptomyces sp. CS131 TaxID=2162711 RepID=UPI000D5100A6|nr:DUF2945 domain-containing protein [Streptomyces sp. CS131]PVC80079.1 DUF2945 domain-containing protein [Streptomyces sp. CS131]